MRNKIAVSVMLAIVALALGACGGLEVKRAASGQVIEGIPYYLPKKSFLISVQFVVKDCSVVTTGNVQNLRLLVEKTASVLPVTEPDPSEKFYIPYSSIRQPFQDISVTVESYDNMTLQTINGTITDKTGETITAALGTALRVASITGGFALTGAESEGLTAQDLCNPDLLKAIEDSKAQLAKAAQAAAKPAADLPAEPAAAKPAPAKPAAKPSLGKPGAKPAPAKPGAKPVPTEPAAKPPTDPATVPVVATGGATYKQLIRWEPKRTDFPDGSTKYTVIHYPDELVTSKLLTAKGIAVAKAIGQAQAKSDFDKDGKIKKLYTVVAFNTIESVASDSPAISAPKGLLLRSPGFGLLRICDIPCPALYADDNNEAVMFAANYAVPQLGTYVVLPLRSGIFRNQTLDVSLSADGVITKIGLSSSASAPAALTSTNTELDALNKAATAQRKAKADAAQAALTKAKTDASIVKDNNNAVADCLKAQAAVLAAGGIVSGSCQ